jgi:hypothetical protein
MTGLRQVGQAGSLRPDGIRSVRVFITLSVLPNWRAEAHPTRRIDISWWRGLQPANGPNGLLGRTRGIK